MKWRNDKKRSHHTSIYLTANYAILLYKKKNKIKLIRCSYTARPSLFWVSSFMSLWSNILFNCAVIINLIVAFFYPFDNGGSGGGDIDDGQRRRMISGERLI